MGGYPIYGYVDDENNIIVTGELPGGTYSVKYELDGEILDIGILTLTLYINQIPISTDASGGVLGIHREPISTYWGAKTTVLMNLLAHYKNVVLLHGHSHYRFDCQELDETTNYTDKNGFRSVHVPSLGRPRKIVDNTPTYVSSESYAYVVDVYDGQVVFNGYDMINSKPEPLGTFRLDTTLQTVEAGTF